MSQFISAGMPGSRAKFALLLLGGFTAFSAFGASNSTDRDDAVPSAVVKYSRDSLATDSGLNDLYAKIKHAAKQVCPDASGLDLGALQRTHECRREAEARAVRNIDNSRLAALYAAHSRNG